MAAHVKATKLDEMLRGTNWQAAGACRILVGEIDMLIARLYNKAERVLVKPGAAESTEKAQDAPAEIPAADELGQGGIAPPKEPE
jgi:hypothetical protein